MSAGHGGRGNPKRLRGSRGQFHRLRRLAGSRLALLTRLDGQRRLDRLVGRVLDDDLERALASASGVERDAVDDQGPGSRWRLANVVWPLASAGRAVELKREIRSGDLNELSGVAGRSRT